MMTHHLLGRNSDGARVTVSINLSEQYYERGVTTTDHYVIDRPISLYRLSIMGGVLGRGDYVHCGQVLEQVADVKQIADGWSVLDLTSLLAVWDRWHLNDVRSWCAHMDRSNLVREDGPYGRQISTRGNPCPDGADFWFGRSWLVEFLPDDVIAEVERLQALPAGALPRWVTEEFSD